MEKNFKREVDIKKLSALSDEINNFPSAEDAKKSIERIIDHCIFETFRAYSQLPKEEVIKVGNGQNLELDDLKKRLKEEIYKIPLNNGHGYQLCKNYERLLGIGVDLTSVNLQKAQLDLSERWRNFFFKILIRFVYVVLILIAGFISMSFGIPIANFLKHLNL